MKASRVSWVIHLTKPASTPSCSETFLMPVKKSVLSMDAWMASAAAEAIWQPSGP